MRRNLRVGGVAPGLAERDYRHFAAPPLGDGHCPRPVTPWSRDSWGKLSGNSVDIYYDRHNNMPLRIPLTGHVATIGASCRRLSGPLSRLDSNYSLQGDRNQGVARAASGRAHHSLRPRKQGRHPPRKSYRLRIPRTPPA